MGDGPPLGLQRGRAAVRAYDPRWPREFEREATALRALLGAQVGIEHVGSTAVPGLAAKPLIDIAIGFADRAALDRGRDALRRAGYDDRGDFGDAGGVILAKGPESNRTHLLHLLESGSRQWHRYQAFRDALRADAGLREEYARLKERLAPTYWDDRQAYLEGKRPFIERTVANVERSARGQAHEVNGAG